MICAQRLRIRFRQIAPAHRILGDAILEWLIWGRRGGFGDAIRLAIWVMRFRISIFGDESIYHVYS